MFNIYKIDSYINETGSYLMSLLITIIGTLLGFLGALFISNLAQKKQRKKEESDIIDFYKGQLSYMSDLIESCIKISKLQIDKFEELAKEIDKKPVDQHLVKVVGSNDLERLQKMDSKDIYHAYQKILPKSNSKMLDYRNIFTTIDIIYLDLKHTIDSVKRKNDFVYRDHMILKEVVDNLVLEIIKIIQSISNRGITAAQKPFFDFLNANYDKMNKLMHEKAEISMYETNFVNPFEIKLQESFQNEETYNGLFTLVTNAKITYAHIKDNSGDFSNQLNEVRPRFVNYN